MSWDLSSEDAITEKLESQHRTILAFAQKIKQQEQELSKLRAQLDVVMRQLDEANEVISRFNVNRKKYVTVLDIHKIRNYQAKYSQKLEGRE